MRVPMWSLAPLLLGVVLVCDLTAAPPGPTGSTGQAAPVVPGQGLTQPQQVAQPDLVPGTGTSPQALSDSVRYEAHAVATGGVGEVLALLASSCRPGQRARIARSVREHRDPTVDPVALNYLVVVGVSGRRRPVHWEITTSEGTRSADEYWTATSGDWRRLCGRGPGRRVG